MLPLAFPLIFPAIAGVFFGKVWLLPSRGVVEDVTMSSEPIVGNCQLGWPVIDGGVGGRPVDEERVPAAFTAPLEAASRGFRNMALNNAYYGPTEVLIA